jgi:hypothetical protein
VVLAVCKDSHERRLSVSQKIKFSLAAAVFLLSVGAGYWWGSKSVPPQVVEKVVTVEKVVEQKVEIAQAKTVTTWKPDGTVVQATEVKAQTVTDKKTETKAERVVATQSPLRTQYKVGLVVSKALKESRPTYEAFLGARVAGPVWVTLHVLPGRRAVGLGLSVEF